MPRKKPREAIHDFDIYGVSTSGSTEADVIHVERIQTRKKLHGWNVQPHRHSGRDQFLLWRSGVAVLHLADKNVTIQAPSLIYMPKGHVHGITLEPDADVCVVSPTRDYLLGAAGPELAAVVLAIRDPLMVKLHTDQNQRLFALFVELETEYEAKAAFYVAACSGLLRLLLSFMQRLLPCVSKLTHGEQSNEHLVSRLRVLIEAEYRKNRRLAEYARDLAVSERHLMRTCQHFSDRTLLQMVLDRRFLEAKHLLRFTDLSISRIAEELGFHDAAHFSRSFKARALRSPQEWRAPGSSVSKK